MSYDSAMIIITAVKNLIKDGKAVTRANVRDQVAGINYSGVTGNISFEPTATTLARRCSQCTPLTPPISGSIRLRCKASRE